VRVVDDGAGRIVAHLAGIPRPLRRGSQVIPAFTLFDAFVAPDFQGRGLYRTMLNSVMAILEEREYRAAFTFPTRTSQQDVWLRHFRWVEPAQLLFGYRLTVGQGRAAKKRPEGLLPETIPAIPQDVDGLIDQSHLRPHVEMARTGAYLRWRYETMPNGNYRFTELRLDGELVGLLVAQVGKRFGMPCAALMELLADETRCPEAGPVLLNHALGSLGREGALFVMAIAARGSGTESALTRAGYRPVPRAVPRQPKVVIKTMGDASATPVDLVGAPWAFTWGDVDVF
jgi:hypothetical protein